MLIAFVAGIFSTFGIQRGISYWQYGQHRNDQALMIWAWRHAPEIIGGPHPSRVRTLDALFTGSESGDMRLIYEQDGAIRVITSEYRVRQGQVLVPTDSQLTELARQSPAFLLPPEARQP